MARSLRSRKPLVKLPEEGSVADAKSKKTGAKKLDVIGEETGSTNLPGEDGIVDRAVVRGPKTRSAKGNLNTGWRTLKAIPTPVLRDRTNLPGEPLKVDLLMKQGTAEVVAKKPPEKSTRRAAKAATSGENDDENARVTSAASGTRKTSRKGEANKVSSSSEGSRDVPESGKPVNSENVQVPKGDTAIKKRGTSGGVVKKSAKSTDSENVQVPKGDAAIKRGTSGGVVKKSAKSTRSATKSSDNKDDENTKKTSSAIGTRKKSRKVETEKESSSVEDAMDIAENAEPEDSENEEAPKVGSTIKRDTGAGVAIKPAKSTRRTVKSATSGKNDDDNAKTTISAGRGMRKKSQKVMAEKESSSDLGEAARDATENDKPVKSGIGIRSAAPAKKVTKKVSARVASKKVPLTKQSDESVDSVKKSSRRDSEVKGNEEVATTSTIGGVENKFFKSKSSAKDARRISLVKKTVNAKRRNIGTRSKARMSVSFRMRQTTLTESFAKQTDRKLRSPQAAKNYCEDSVIAMKRASSKSNEINAERDKAEKGKVGPVYKLVKLQDNPVNNNKNEIYEFKFDSNDSREKLPKKRKKRIVTNKKTKATGSRPKKMTSSETRAIAKTAITKIATGGEKKIEKPEVVERVSRESTQPSSPQAMELEAAPCDAMEIDQVTPEKPSILPVINVEVSKNVAQPIAKPVIVETMELKGSDRINLTATPILVKSSEGKSRIVPKPLKQYKTMLRHALLNKSISPITKAIESFDPGSPWRPPTFIHQQFSRVENIVQSTPRPTTFSARLDNPGARMNKILKQNEGSTKVSQILEKESPSKAIGLAKSPRQFGREISNVSNVSPIVTRVIDNEDKENSGENRMLPQKTASVASEARVPSTSNDTTSDGHVEAINSFNDDLEDKENYLPARPSPKVSPLKALNKSPLKSPNKSPIGSPKKSPLKSLNKSPLESLNKSSLKSLNKSPLKSLKKSPLESPTKLTCSVNPERALNKMSSVTNENLEPQAGPSNSKNSYPLDDSRVLLQSNLDNFLNLDEVPKSTRISTIHGIFDDAHSTPMRGKPVRKVSNDPNVENAFGFDEYDDTDIDVSPIKRPFPSRQVAQRALTGAQNVRGKIDIAVPARLSVGDIKKHLLPIREKPRVNDDPIIERIEEEETENRDNNKERQTVPEIKNNPITLIDTFDLLAEKAESSDTSAKEIPLFTDIEPEHFKQAPRYSYKRKRAATFILSDNEEKNENPLGAKHHGSKRRKINRVEKEREKQMENWAKDINQTFEEIDHFDLVVE